MSEEKKENNHAHVILLLDSSGSMNSIRDATKTSVEAFLKEQQRNPNADNVYITYVTFSDTYEIVEKKPVLEYKEVAYQPDGSTALYDTCSDVFNKFKDESNVMVVIITDGEDNTSRVSRKDIFTMIKDLKVNKKWEFMYLGANQDAFKEASKMGITSSANYNADSRGVANMMRQTSAHVSNYVSSRTPLRNATSP